MVPCEHCNGTGYLIESEYGFSHPADGMIRDGEIAIPVQRCDACAEILYDEWAADKALIWEYECDGIVVLGEVREGLDDSCPPDWFVITTVESWERSKTVRKTPWN